MPLLWDCSFPSLGTYWPMALMNGKGGSSSSHFIKTEEEDCHHVDADADAGGP